MGMWEKGRVIVGYRGVNPTYTYMAAEDNVPRLAGEQKSALKNTL